MASELVPFLNRATNNNGSPISGARLFFYATGTLTPASVFSDAERTTPHTNPVVADSAGLFAAIYLNPAITYRAILQDPAGATIWDIDPVNSSLLSALAASGGAALVGKAGGGTVQDALPFDTVAELLADTGAARGEGSIWRAGEFVYTEAASSATDHHVVTAGGVKLYALPLGGEFFASQFATLAKAFDVSAKAKQTLVLSGDYTVSGQLLGILSGSAELHLRLAGDVTITVDAAAAWFQELILLQTDTINNVSIVGGSLTIVGNKKISAGLWFRHLAAADGGVVNIDAPVTVLDLEGPSASAVTVGGIIVLGRYSRIIMQSPRVEDAIRLNAGGETSGITCSGFVGDVEIYSPVTKRIFTGPSLVDADGIKTFGFARNGIDNRRDGRVRIYDAFFEDCEGRSFKDQTGDTVLYCPRVKRDAAVKQSIAQSVEFDFQMGGGLLIDPVCEYTADGATSPIGASASIVAFQHRLEDYEMVGRMRNLTVISDVEIPRIAFGIYGAGAQQSLIEIDGVKLVPKAGFTGTMVSRAIFEFDMSGVVAKTAKTRIKIRRVDGPNTWSIIGYTGYTSGDLSGKLSWSVTDCINPLGPAGAQTRPFHNISGNPVLSVEEFEMHGLTGYRDLFTGAWSVDFRKLTSGTVLTVDISAVAATNAPLWGASGFAYIRCEGQYFGATERTVWVVKDNADNVWFTRDGGGTWGVIK